ncbi:ShlB/FhaC/HecB family hemolysin secretion/activation protein [Janthinobacterium agaricidamnosum]|uniref:POTRA domain, ShlB-type family protein n=1 Tax=Janthinobacterium agaricidamnosum NBRC 102515 = DSM 9628 TaxID=1349767 RepID=W0V6V8_9BURK|nr:ShlB/FhaC/HecB family hemolysin secretion/activation protein [Janthinobacterium agaricidamnosum]CDG82987.1 POTRA domain, ShlB-type family protein [Janthinobacterium agaricidamnosum NBRC 102515 = DSM 9628]
MRHRITARCGFYVLGTVLAFPVIAQTRPDFTPPSATPPASRPGTSDDSSQEFIRQQERERILRQQQEQRPDVRLPAGAALKQAARLPSGETPCFAIRTLALAGEAAGQFQWALAAAGRDEDGQADPVTGRCVGTEGINLAMRRVQNAIMNRGYVTTRVLAAPQDLSSGTLTLSLLPGRIRAVRPAPGTSSRTTLWNAMAAGPGDLLNVRDTEQALENFKRVPSADADIQIAPAEGADARPGESDLVVQWKQGVPFRLSLSLDDSGSDSTGKYQGGVTLSYDNWWTLNDLFYLSLNSNVGGGGSGPHGTRGVVAHYSLPLGYWLLSATTSDSGYHQSVAGINQDYHYSGASQNSEIKLSRLVYRDAVRKTSVSLRGWKRSSQNFIDDTEVEVQRRRVAGWEAGLGHREFMGRATLDANLQYRRGSGAFDAMAAPEEAFGEGTSRFVLLLADASLGAPLDVGPLKLRYAGAWRWQHNRTPLVPQDRFAIGGRYTVRGYDGESSLSAERGWLLRNELGAPLGDSGHELYGGIDHGEVAGPGSALLVAHRLTGMFVGLRGQLMRLQYDVFIGRPWHKPDLFRSAPSTAGFNLNASF